MSFYLISRAFCGIIDVEWILNQPTDKRSPSATTAGEIPPKIFPANIAGFHIIQTRRKCLTDFSQAFKISMSTLTS